MVKFLKIIYIVYSQPQNKIVDTLMLGFSKLYHINIQICFVGYDTI
jgi:hypothetical protein